MKSLKKSLAMFLAVVMLVSSFSFAGIAAETSDVIYSVETYFMDTFGVYPSVPDEIAEYYANAGETVVLSAEEKEGFTFDSEESIVEFEVQADGSSVGKIFYSRNKYKATYIYEDLLGAQSEESSVYFEAEIPGFEANPSGKPAKQGYNFIMWSLDETERISVPAVMPAYDIEMYPIYEIKTYTFTFDAGEGGSFSNGMQTITYEYKYGEIPVIPESPSMPHMEFIDWDNNIPETVTSNMAFGAMYNEITYAAIFMDGEDEISYMDGYFYGDIIEDLDIPEGYEAWTLSDGTYVSFPYTVTGNVVFYASAAPSEYTVRFYLDINDSEPYEEFSVLQGEEIDFPAEPEKIGHTFVRWTPDITVMPNEDVDFIAEWEVNLYTVNFDTNGGTEISPLTFDYGSNIELTEIPARDGFVFVGWNGMPEDGKMPANDIALTAEWKKYVDPDSLNIRTEIYRQDEVTGEWVVADKVERGETVKARVFIETGFAVGEGQVLCFFNEDVFTIEDLNGDPLVLNPSPTATTSVYSVEGSCATPPKTHSTFEDLVNFGYISEEFLETHTPVTFRFGFTSFKCHSISGDEWFAEFELTAKEDAVGEGNFFVVPETIANSGDGYYAYISFTRGVEGESSLENVEDMFGWDASTTVESNPVSTGYGRIVYDANGGCFADGSTKILSSCECDTPVYAPDEIPSMDGYEFIGWSDENGNLYSCGEVIGTMSLDGVYIKAEWLLISVYNVTFDSNGGAETLSPVTAQAGTIINLPDYYRDGFIFMGWLNSNDGEMYLAGESFTVPEYDVIFIAVWEEITTEPTTVETTEPTTKEEPSTTEPVTESSTTEPVTEPSTTEPITEPSTQPTTATTTKPVTTTKPTTVHTHSLKTVIENATCEKEGKKYSVCNDCGKTVGNVTVIPALGHSAGDWQIVLEPTYDTEGKKIRKCVRNGCGKILEEAVIPVLEPETVEFSIKTPSRTTISYGDSIYLHAVVELPAGAEVVWEASNSNFSYSTSSDGKTCLISPVSSGETTFTAKVVDEKGNVISETDTQVMTSNAGFFQKIIAFFKKLFGLTKVYPDKVVTVYDK